MYQDHPDVFNFWTLLMLRLYFLFLNNEYVFSCLNHYYYLFTFYIVTF